jgi:hypothetical protein
MIRPSFNRFTWRVYLVILLLCITTLSVASAAPPAGVTDLHNTTYVPDLIAWAWEDPEEECFTHVMVYIDGTFSANVSKGTESYTAMALTSATNYTIGIRSVGGCGVNATWVNTTAMTSPVPPCIPDSVTDLTNITYLKNCMAWEWEDPESDCFENVSVYLNGVFEASVPAGTGYFQATGLAPDTDYTLSTRTVGSDGVANGTWVNNTARTARDPPCVPDAVTDLENTTFLVESITWTWDDPDDGCFDFVKVYLDGVFQVNAPKDTEIFEATNLTPDTNYTLSTRAAGNEGGVNGTWVNSTTRTAPEPPCIPESVTELSNTTFLMNSITWEWEDPEDECFENVSVYLDGVFKASLPDETETYTATNLTPDTAYTLSTRTMGSDGVANSTWVNSTVKTAPIPWCIPESVSELHNTTYLQNYIRWEWEDPEDECFENVSVYLNGVFKASLPDETEEFIASGLTANTFYTLSTRTMGSDGVPNGTWVNSTVKTAPLGPKGSLYVYTIPSNATIFIDGIPFGRTNNLFSGIDAGLRTLTITKPGFQTKIIPVNIPAGGVKVLAPITLQRGGPSPLNGTLYVYSSPSNATILIDGVARGHTNTLVIDVMSGLRNLTLTKPGFKTKTIFVDVPAGDLKVLAPINLAPA